jgi:hypothetical protein
MEERAEQQAAAAYRGLINQTPSPVGRRWRSFQFEFFAGLARSGRKADDGHTVVHLDAPGQMIRDYKCTDHHHHHGDGAEHQADRIERFPIGHGRSNQYLRNAQSSEMRVLVMIQTHQSPTSSQAGGNGWRLVRLAAAAG